jgi:hypothetical protein
MPKSWRIEDGIPDYKPLILGFVSDLLFTSRIEDVANKLHYEVYWIVSIEQISPFTQDVTRVQLENKDSNLSPGEQLSGIEGQMLDLVTRQQPALILFDLGNKAIPWRQWLPVLKSVPATRRIPILCYGSHVDVESFRFARSGGADVVVARSRFVTDLPDLIKMNVRLPDYAGLVNACNQALSPLAVRGLEEFNRGEYYEAHESLEAAWNEDQSPGRELYRAILQVSVAYLQIQRMNYRGAMKIFMRLRQWIDPLPDSCRGVDVHRLKLDAERVQEELARLGSEGIGEFNFGLFRPVYYKIVE